MHSGVLNADWIKITLHMWTQGYQSIYKCNVYLTHNAKSILQNILMDFNIGGHTGKSIKVTKDIY